MPEQIVPATVELLPWQERVMLLPEEWDLFLGGGRGGGKTRALLLLILRHCATYGERSRVLVLRRTYKALEDLVSTAQVLFGAAYGTAARFNLAEHTCRLPEGGYIEFGQLDGSGDYAKFQGRSFSFLAVDEVGSYADPRLLELVRSNLRAPHGVPTRTVYTANPGGIGTGWIVKRHVYNGTAPWHPYVEPETGRTWVTVPSTFEENVFIDREQYRLQLEAACAHDEGLLAAWKTGDWAKASAGAFFSSVLSDLRSAFGPWQPADWPKADRQKGDRWDLWLAMDYGSSAPAVVYVVAESPGAKGPDGVFYPRGSVLLVDELATSDPSNPAVGLGWTIPKLAEAVKALAARWDIRPEGVADDACFSHHGHDAGSIADEFSSYDVRWDPARKGDRRTRWEHMRTLLADAGKPDRPGLYISRACSYWWETVPMLPRDPRNPEDVDTRAVDHAADASSYALVRERNTLSVVESPWY